MNLETWLTLSLLDHTQQVLTLAAAIMAGLTVAILAPRIRLPRRSTTARLVDYTQAEADGTFPDTAPVIGDIRIDPEAVILASLGLPPLPHMLLYVRIAAGVIPALLLLLLGYPFIPALGAGGLGAILAHTYLKGRWRTFCNQVEQDLPTFASRLSGTLLVSSAPVAALEEVVEGLEAKTPLRQWMEAFLQGLRGPGRLHFIGQAQHSAGQISPSLALLVFEIGRLLETGGAGFAQAFTSTAEHLTSILKARAVARSKAEAARNAVLTMIGIMGFILLLMLSSPQTRKGYEDPTVQLVAAACLGVMAFGYLFLNNLIDEALEA